MFKSRSSTVSPNDFIRAISSPIEFAKFCTLIVTEENTTRKVRFEEVAWEWQYDLLNQFHMHDRIIILKARQLGVTWLACIYALYTLFTQANATVLAFSTTEREAQQIIDRIDFIYENLPDTIRLANPITKPYSRSEIGFLNGSHILAMPSTERAGRSYTASLVILDEFAFHEHANKLFAAVLAAVEKGKLIIISTANGIGNLFYTLYSEAKAGKNGFHPIFLPYNLHPRRTLDWYQEQSRQLPQSQLQQEYPVNDVEAFILTGNHYFDPQLLRTHQPKQPLPLDAYRGMLRRTPPYMWSYLKVYEMPIIGHSYSTGVDPTNAVSARADNAAIVVLDAVTGNQVIEFAGQFSIDDLLPLICDINDFYGGIVVVERNGVGAELNKRLNALKVPLWMGTYLQITQATSGREAMAWGLHVNKATKMIIFSQLSTALEKNQIHIASEELLREMQCLEVSPQTKLPKQGAMKDDRVYALAYAWMGVLWLREQGKATEVHPLPDQFNLDWYLRRSAEVALLTPPIPNRRLLPL